MAQKYNPPLKLKGERFNRDGSERYHMKATSAYEYVDGKVVIKGSSKV